MWLYPMTRKKGLDCNIHCSSQSSGCSVSVSVGMLFRIHTNCRGYAVIFVQKLFNVTVSCWFRRLDKDIYLLINWLIIIFNELLNQESFLNMESQLKKIFYLIFATIYRNFYMVKKIFFSIAICYFFTTTFALYIFRYR